MRLSYPPSLETLPSIYQPLYLAQEIVLIKLTKLLPACSFAELYFCLGQAGHYEVEEIRWVTNLRWLLAMLLNSDHLFGSISTAM